MVVVPPDADGDFDLPAVELAGRHGHRLAAGDGELHHLHLLGLDVEVAERRRVALGERQRPSTT
jgi:hypothetical protein